MRKRPLVYSIANSIGKMPISQGLPIIAEMRVLTNCLPFLKARYLMYDE
jgi:hypothetical protein